MHRRNFLAAAMGATFGGSAVSTKALAYQRCMPAYNQFGQMCEAGIDPAKLLAAYRPQKESQWCWAASLSMIFAFYGYDVPQEAIVTAVYGRLDNLPAKSGATITAELNRDWADAHGKQFQVQMQGLYDLDAGILGLNNAQIVDALQSERPLLMGNATHAIVQVSAAFIPTPMGPNVVNCGFIDPYPGIGLRPPSNPAEMIPMHMGGQLRYLALPVVTPI